MTTPTNTPRTSTRVRLLEAMMALDDHRSVQEHSVAELAAAAKVAKGSVYYQFGSKEELVREMLVHGASQLKDQMAEASSLVHSSGATTESMAAALTAALGFLDRHPSFTGLVAYVLARRRDDEAEHMRQEKEAMVSLLAERLHQVHQQSSAPDENSAVPAEQHTQQIPEKQEYMAATALLSAAVTLSIERHTSHPDWSIADCTQVLMGLVNGTVSYTFLTGQ